MIKKTLKIKRPESTDIKVSELGKMDLQQLGQRRIQGEGCRFQSLRSNFSQKYPMIYKLKEKLIMKLLETYKIQMKEQLCKY